jgi:Short C-terminal domain
MARRGPVEATSHNREVGGSNPPGATQRNPLTGSSRTRCGVPCAAMDEGAVRVSPVGVGLALLGALMMIISVFLPRLEETTFSLAGVAENTLIQSGDGWILLGLAAGVIGSTYRAYQSGEAGWTVVVLGALAIAYAVYVGTDDELLTLYPLDAQGNPDTSQGGEAAKPGVGIYAAGVGGALAAFGGWQQRTYEHVAPLAMPPTDAVEPSSETSVASPASTTIRDLERLQELHRSGALTDEQFEAQKERVLRDS